MNMKRLQGWRRGLFLLCLALCLLIGWGIPGLAQDATDVPVRTTSVELQVADAQLDGYPVVLNGQVLFRVQNPVGPFSAEERAAAISRRLNQLALDRTLDPSRLLVRPQRGGDVGIFYGSQLILVVTEEDGETAGQDPLTLALERLGRVRTAITEYRQKRSWSYLLPSLGMALLATILFGLALRVLFAVTPRLMGRLETERDQQRLALRLGQIVLLPARRVVDLLLEVLRLLHLGLILIFAYFYLIEVLILFPWTEQLARSLLLSLLAGLETGLSLLAGYLPNLGAVFLIALITYYVLRLVRLVFLEVKQGNLVLPGFYSEWADPTFVLVSISIFALAAGLAMPYLPGFGSPAFQGVSIFLGVLLSLGSTATITNVVAGFILIYTRAFQVGDRIQIGETLGDVVEKTLLATRLRTPLNVLVTIPNAMILGTSISNFSTSSREMDIGLLLCTTVTLGYDIPWRTIHATLVEAALATEHVLSEPAPFVFQTSLEDNYVSYTLHVYTLQPQKMGLIRSQLNQNIQDKCNEAGIEILSPAYSALRDGNSSTIPESYLPKDYIAPGFRWFPNQGSPSDGSRERG
ncbi:MAG: mechanosensitive ion channel family protein [Thermostichus sp. BF3_bins_97]